METTDDSAKILKSISIFGGLQFFLIIINLLKGKAVASLIGVAGVGEFSMLNNILSLIVQFAFFGLNFSAVRSISLSFEKNDYDLLQRTNSTFWYLTILCSFFGLVLTLIGSRYISQIAFKSSSYTELIIFLSAGVFFTILFNGNQAFLQGIRDLKNLAKASFLSALFGLLISLPLFYLYPERGIVFSIVITAFLSFIFSSYFAKKNKFNILKLSYKQVFEDGSEMIRLGAVMMVSSFIGILVINIINIYIVREGSVTDLGMFAAGSSITNQSVGLIFTAMAVDYFPKLSSVSKDDQKVNALVNNQGEIILTVICPILLVLMLFSPFAVHLLLTKEFLSISSFISIMCVAIIFKAASFPIGYISFAKGDKKMFFLFEGVLSSILILAGHVLGYYFGGVDGIAWGILILYVLYFLILNIFANLNYNFKLNREYLKILMISCVFLIIAFLNIRFVENYLKYIFGVVLIVGSLYYSYRKLNDKVGLAEFVYKKINAVLKR